jgi:DNA-binding response OmpR family regulator
VRAILRRMERAGALGAATPDVTLIRFDLVIDPSRRRVQQAGADVALTPLEFEILLALAQSPGVVFAREQLMERVWGYRDHAGGRVVDSHVARIRRKLRDEAAEPRYIRTVHWVGYTFREASE